jgi:hypothetical protein
MKLTSLEEELQTLFVACWRSDVTPVVTRSMTADMEIKMATQPEKEFCVLKFNSTKSATIVQ